MSIKDRVKACIDQEDGPFMVSEIAEHMSITYDTAKAHLLALAAEGTLNMRKISRHWIFWKTKK